MQDLIDSGMLRKLGGSHAGAKPRGFRNGSKTYQTDSEGRLHCPVASCGKTYSCVVSLNAHFKSKHPESCALHQRQRGQLGEPSTNKTMSQASSQIVVPIVNQVAMPTLLDAKTSTVVKGVQWRDGRSAGVLPEGWTVTQHVSATGVSTYKRYAGPNGRTAQSVRDAWRKHSEQVKAVAATTYPTAMDCIQSTPATKADSGYVSLTLIPYAPQQVVLQTVLASKVVEISPVPTRADNTASKPAIVVHIASKPASQVDIASKPSQVDIASKPTNVVDIASKPASVIHTASNPASVVDASPEDLD